MVRDLGKAYEKPMDRNDPNTTAQPQPPSGGVQPISAAVAGDIVGTSQTDEK